MPRGFCSRHVSTRSSCLQPKSLLHAMLEGYIHRCPGPGATMMEGLTFTRTLHLRLRRLHASQDAPNAFRVALY